MPCTESIGYQKEFFTCSVLTSVLMKRLSFLILSAVLSFEKIPFAKTFRLSSFFLRVLKSAEAIFEVWASMVLARVESSKKNRTAFFTRGNFVLLRTAKTCEYFAKEV